MRTVELKLNAFLFLCTQMNLLGTNEEAIHKLEFDQLLLGAFKKKVVTWETLVLPRSSTNEPFSLGKVLSYS